MNIRFIIPLLLLFLLPQVVWAYTGREIMEQNEKLVSPQTAVSTVTMYVHKGKRVDEKEFILFAKEYPEDEDKTLLSFHKPTQIKLLTHAHQEAPDDQWLVLSSGRVKRISSSDKGKSFVHSHFYYEDLSSRDIDDYEYTYLGDEKVLDTDCYMVESIKKDDADKVYDKMVVYVRKSDFFIVRVDFYQEGRLHKILENHDIRRLNDILTPFLVVMSLADGREKTELKLEHVEYNAPIEDIKFKKEALR